jgi:DNA processing protein
VVSGGALGVDGAAHRGALDAGGRTVVVLGTGIDVAYPPQHGPLFDEAVACGGAVVTEFPPGARPRMGSFPTRNRIIAGLAEATVVVEAGARSGSLHTARAARRFGRRTIALPGSPGCEALLTMGLAEPAGSADEALALIQHPASAATPRPAAPPAARQRPPLPIDPRALRLYQALDRTPRDLGEVAARAGLAASDALALAIELELGGLAARAAGGRYLRLD